MTQYKIVKQDLPRTPRLANASTNALSGVERSGVLAAVGGPTTSGAAAAGWNASFERKVNEEKRGRTGPHPFKKEQKGLNDTINHTEKDVFRAEGETGPMGGRKREYVKRGTGHSEGRGRTQGHAVKRGMNAPTKG